MSKREKLTEQQSLVTDLEREDMKSIPYARLVGSLIYAQVCAKPNLVYVTCILPEFQSNLGYNH